MESYSILVIPENQKGSMLSPTRVSLIGTPRPLTMMEPKSYLLMNGAVAGEHAAGHGIRLIGGLMLFMILMMES